MTGQEHYEEAERLLAAYKDAISAAEQMPSDTLQLSDERHLAAGNAHALLSKASVHATLALAAPALQPPPMYVPAAP